MSGQAGWWDVDRRREDEGSSGNTKKPTHLAAAAGPSLGVIGPFAHLLFTQQLPCKVI